MNVVVINPPLVQLNTPYPSGAYLKAFFTRQGASSLWYDLSVELYYSIFSKEGLTKLFELTEAKALKMAQKAQNQKDEYTAFNLRRYVSTKVLWINWIDFITQTLCHGKDCTREKQHQFLYSPFVPRGNRMDNFLANLPDQPDTDDVRFLCSYALADLADYITAVFDPQFSLIRYAEEVCAQEPDFSQIKQLLDSPVMKEFYFPVLEKFFGRSGNRLPSGFCCKSSEPSVPPVFPPQSLTQKTLVCISVPFAGTFIPALFTARYFKQTYGDSVYVCLGGGYVNTEMRKTTDPCLAEFCDALSFDRGYGSYYELGFNNSETVELKKTALEPVYKLRKFLKDQNGKVTVVEPLWENKEIQLLEDEFTKSIVPDFSDIDFSRYPRLCDDKNPMHRLWSDGSWVKVYLAHGCYWHKCAFCDTKLDYVCAYKPTQIQNIYDGLLNTARTKGVYGIHFVDEALPPLLIKNFALLNARNGNPLYFWGNVRFEKTFTKDLAAFLSYCGLGGVSAGIESATGTGLENINKGTDISSIVQACAAFKEAGILVHAYMIYGFWNDTPQSIIDSMETLRQFFEAGLLDSSFWHKFMLTKNSTLYDKLKNTWKGGAEFAKFGEGLDSAVQAWMHGDKLQTKVQKWFDFPVPASTVSKDFIEKHIEKYESINSKPVDFSANKNQYFWLGSKPVVSGNEICWFYLQEEFSIKNDDEKIKAEELIELLESLRPERSEVIHEKATNIVLNNLQLQKLLNKLHNKGFVCV